MATIIKDGDENFVQSVMRCISWSATGGKSISTFAKTLDERYTLKFVPKNEFRMFNDNAKKLAFKN